MGRLLILAAILALLAFPALARAQGGGEKLGMALDPDIEALLKRPEKISYRFERIPKAEGDGALVACDIQSACLAKAATLFGVFTDFTQSKRLNPSVFENSHDLSRWPPYFISDQIVGFSILGIKVKYHFSLESYYFQEGPGEYRGYWNMLENPDRTFKSIEGSFYLSEIIKDGRTLTYIRWKQEMRIRRTFIGMKAFVDAIAPKEAMGLIARYSREAERREAEAERIETPSRP
jgi:hypothetical protein